ncbi:MAG TPA: hypothetical protein VKR79_07590 [Gaiellaceae bacterium]|nr:hypothetical protein [Gaiellaceae bacterium]
MRRHEKSTLSHTSDDVETIGGEPLVGEVKKIWSSFSLISDSAEGVRIPFDREEAKRLANEIAEGASLTALG